MDVVDSIVGNCVDLADLPLCHIANIIFQEISLKLNLDSMEDMSRGCDQLVLCLSCESDSKDERGTSLKKRVVIKVPRREKDKVEKQILLAEKALQGGYNISPILYHSKDFLVEEFLCGSTLSIEKHGTVASIWKELGLQMMLLHRLSGASGHSSRVEGESCEKFPIFSTYQEKVGNKILWQDPEVSPININEYFSQMLQTVRRCKPVFLHYDIGFDNIIVCDDSNEVFLIDFADSGMGDPMEDFAELVSLLYDTPQMENVIEGYGGVSEEDRIYMEFFCLVRMSWALSSPNKPLRRLHELAVAQNILDKHMSAGYWHPSN